MSRRFKGNVNVAADDIEKEEEEEEEYDDDYNYDYDKKRKKKWKLYLTNGCSYTYKRAKKMVSSPFNKVYTRFNHSRSCSINSKSLTPTATANLCGNTKASKLSCCCLCFSNPQTLETSGDGNDPDEVYVNYNSLKSLIENNDFYSKDCNTHFPD